MPLSEIDPLQDARWSALVESHPRSSIFHTAEWLEALRRTYQYVPRVLTTCEMGTPLTNGIVFCQVNSWLTGAKLVSLPFSDHCDPLVQDAPDLQVLIFAVRKNAAINLRHAEIRPRSIEVGAYCEGVPHRRYHFHVLDLSPSIEELHSRLHKDGMQRKIRRADRERVVLDQGQSDTLLKEFYQLLLLTRRRQGVPPQPLAWFRNLVDCFSDRLTIRVARVDGQPIASILTLRHKKSIVYKYGCSDQRFHKLGAMPRLFWQAIQDAKAEQLVELDLGRSDESNSGLVRFKDHLGATRTSIKYWQFPPTASPSASSINGLKSPIIVQSLLSHLPNTLFRLTGEIFYRHFG